MLALIWTAGVDTSVHYQYVELFSGVGHVSSRFTAAGKPTAYFDKVHSDKHMNFESPAGFALLAWTFTFKVRLSYSIVIPMFCFDVKARKATTPTPFKVHTAGAVLLRLATLLVLRLAPGGLLLCAPECGSWTVVSRGTSKRTPINVLGDCAFEFVRRANMTLGRLLGINLRLKAKLNSHDSLDATFLSSFD